MKKIKPWRERLLKPKPNERLWRDAADWKTCAIGEQHQLHPEVVIIDSTYGEPNDSELMRLGLDFDSAIEFEEYKQAEEILDQIEDRVLQLKRKAKL